MISKSSDDPGIPNILAAASFNCSIAAGCTCASVATSGKGIVAVFNPQMYTSPLTRLNSSGENPRALVTKTAWHPSSSRKLFRRGDFNSNECPASGEMGILILAEGNKSLKILGDHAPAVITRRVQGTG
jgi:hypothetical protein